MSIRVPINGQADPNNSSAVTLCCVPGCERRYGTFYKFPHPERCPRAYHIWLRRIGCFKLNAVPPTQVFHNRFMCESHFDERCIRKLKRDRTKLIWGSLPTLNLKNFHEESKPTTYCLAELISAFNKPSNHGDYPKEDLSFLARFDVMKSTTRNLIPVNNRSMDIVLKDGERLLEAIPMNEGEIILVQNEADIGNDIPPLVPFSSQQSSVWRNVLERNRKIFEYKKPYFDGLKYFMKGDDSNTLEACRICLDAISEFDCIRIGNADEFSRISSIIPQILPNFDYDLHRRGVICLKCVDLIEKSHELQTKFSRSQTQFKEIVDRSKSTITKIESASIFILRNGTNYDDFLRHRFNVMENSFFLSDHNYGANGSSLLNCGDGTEIVITGKQMHDQISENEYQLKPWVVKPGEASPPYLCDRCPASSDSYKLFQRHYHYHHVRVKVRKPKKMGISYLCSVCGHVCTSATYKGHMMSHEEPNWKCELCQKALRSQNALKTHVAKVHLGIYDRCQCHLCGIEFGYKTSLRQHMKIHEGDRARKHKCPVCDKRFFVHAKLRLHMDRHTGGDHTCDRCGKTLKSKAGLKIHVRVFHEGKGGTKCDICEKTYWKRMDLVSHMFKIHGVHVSSSIKAK